MKDVSVLKPEIEIDIDIDIDNEVYAYLENLRIHGGWRTFCREYKVGE
ncbi:MAG: hypothetical protein HPY71_00425 [Firmicutes bacterium]|nr:hypothetical protein [Bacillota bacterium]